MIPAPNVNAIGAGPGAFTSRPGLSGSPAGNSAAVEKERAAAQVRFEAFKSARYQEIASHEAAHAAGLGNMAAGGPVIEYDANGVAFAGHVAVKPFGVDPVDPAKSYANAQAVFNGATAVGGGMSGADAAIAGKAAQVMFQAGQLMSRQKAGQGKPNGGSVPSSNQVAGQPVGV